MTDRVVLIDGTALIYRAYFAIPSTFTAPDGTHTNATYGFALMFRKLLAGRAPKFGAVVFDPPGKTFRDEQLAAYKADRPPMPHDMREQLPWIDEVVAAHDFPVLRVSGYEADDVIGTLTELAVAAGHEVVIVSGDKDFAQLIRPGVKMIDTMRDVSFDEELVRKKWGVLPSQFVDHLALMGDSVDGIPGVPGIGQKGSAALLERFGSLDGVYAALDALKGRQRENLEKHRDQAYLSRSLATIDRAVPIKVALEDLALRPVDGARVNALYRRLAFNSLITGDDAVDDPAPSRDRVEVIEAAARLDAWLAAGAEVVHAVALALDRDNAACAVWIGTALCRDSEAVYVPAGCPAHRTLGAFLTSDRPKVGHHVRDALCVLQRHELVGARFSGDTALASFLVDPTKCIPHDLNRVAKEYLQRTVPAARGVAAGGLATASVEAAAAWAAAQARAILDLWPVLRDRMEDLGQTDYCRDVELPLSEVLAGMTVAGIRVLPAVLQELQRAFGERRASVELEIHALAGRPFNVGSSKQLGDVLFDELKLDVVKRSKTGYSTAADVLERLAPKHPIARKVIDWRALDKLINTYTDVLQSAVDPRDGRVHATFQQTAGASGRLITTDPDLQRTPIRTEDGKRIREAFVPRAGWTLISADWSQIELRVLAHCSRDPLLIRAFSERIDLHRQTASRIFDLPPDDVTRAQRTVGKTVNFATIYGQGATALGQQLGVPRKEAQAMIERYFATYAGVRAWLDDTVARAYATGFCETILGRRRQIPELKSHNWTDRGYGERIAANTPIQGSAADICKVAMLQIAQRLRAEGMQTQMLVQIHDELLFECPPGEVEAARALIRDRMERCVALAVPLEVDLGAGPSWAAAH